MTFNQWWNEIYLRNFIQYADGLDNEGRAIWAEVAAEEIERHAKEES